MDGTSAIQSFSLPGSVTVGEQTLHYIRQGNGSKVAIAFHGYGKDASLFEFLYHEDFTVLSFDLPFQGASEGISGAVLTKENVCELIKIIQEEYQVQKIGLVGFSLGARVCLCIAEQMPGLIRNIVLIAPDGIRHNYFYHFLTGSMLGRSMFRGFVKYGTAYLQLFALLRKVGVLSRYRYKFAIQYIRTPESRQLLIDIWMNTRKLVPNLEKLKKNIRSYSIPVHILMGQQDQVIPMKNAVLFKGHNEHIHLHVFDRNHNLLDYEEVKGTVAAWLFRTNPGPRTV